MYSTHYLQDICCNIIFILFFLFKLKLLQRWYYQSCIWDFILYIKLWLNTVTNIKCIMFLAEISTTLYSFIVLCKLTCRTCLTWCLSTGLVIPCNTISTSCFPCIRLLTSRTCCTNNCTRSAVLSCITSHTCSWCTLSSIWISSASTACYFGCTSSTTEK